MIKYRKCPECSGRMSVKNSSKGRFWGCDNYPDCRTTFEYYHKPKTGLDLEIREIDNGYLIRIMQKFAEKVEDQDPKEMHCSTLDAMRKLLKEILVEQANNLVDKFEIDLGFTDETPPAKKAERVKKIKDDSNIKDVRLLMEQVRKSNAENNPPNY